MHLTGLLLGVSGPARGLLLCSACQVHLAGLLHLTTGRPAEEEFRNGMMVRHSKVDVVKDYVSKSTKCLDVLAYMGEVLRDIVNHLGMDYSPQNLVDIWANLKQKGMRKVTLKLHPDKASGAWALTYCASVARQPAWTRALGL